MARYSKAVWKPLPENSTEPTIKPTQIILHSAVSNADSLAGYFNSKGVDVEAHFYVRKDGTVEQYLDTTRQADANYKANVRAISIETWDGGNPDKNPWTQKQLDALVDLIGWLCDTHGIPAKVCPAWDKPGIGYHTMFGAPGPWTPIAKTCPGKARIPQFAGIVKAVADAPSSGGAKASVIPAGQRLLKVGSRGDDVKFVQGKVGAAVDGIFGPETEAKVKEYQRRNGLVADGIVGPKTWGKLLAKPKALPLLRQGSTGEYVKIVQRKLGVKVDGIFGPITDRAVRDFQRKNKLVVDGIVGPQTWARLGV